MLRQCIQMAILNYGVGGVVFGKQSEAAQQGVQADGLPVLQCAECGEQTSMNHKESCSKRRRWSVE